MANGGTSDSVVPYAGVGGIAVCCLGLELLGGAAILGGLATTIGLSTGLTYLAVVGISGLMAVVIAFGYRQFGGVSNSLGGVN